jgi:hypothetical protein
MFTNMMSEDLTAVRIHCRVFHRLEGQHVSFHFEASWFSYRSAHLVRSGKRTITHIVPLTFCA